MMKFSVMWSRVQPWRSLDYDSLEICPTEQSMAFVNNQKIVVAMDYNVFITKFTLLGARVSLAHWKVWFTWFYVCMYWDGALNSIYQSRCGCSLRKNGPYQILLWPQRKGKLKAWMVIKNFLPLSHPISTNVQMRYCYNRICEFS